MEYLKTIVCLVSFGQKTLGTTLEEHWDKRWQVTMKSCHLEKYQQLGPITFNLAKKGWDEHLTGNTDRAEALFNVESEILKFKEL